MSHTRILSWLKRQLPTADARHVDVRDGDELVARIALPKGRAVCEEMATEIAEAVEGSDARTLAIVAVDRQGVDVVSMTLARPNGKREARAPSAFLGSLMRDNEALRASVIHSHEQTLRALLAENARLAEQVAKSEARQLETWQLVEELTSLRAERDAALQAAERRDKRQRDAFEVLKSEVMPRVVAHLEAGPSGGRQTLSRVFAAAVEHAPDELQAIVSKLPADVAQEMSDALDAAAKSEILAGIGKRTAETEKRGNGVGHA